jgi:NADPH-dependent curcumin reductase CurA
MLKSDFGFDAAINYNTTNNMAGAITCQTVDVYFDNVEGITGCRTLILINLLEW